MFSPQRLRSKHLRKMVLAKK
ncbi:hypothetical protein F383_24913 [Gossypium arboreum]|uniref:Uncharacterized protein n=2 Tax=Gossypium TaxID=3633 RepID=A0A0B0MQ55_GOSAR|nr:hypothetical protein F383_24913 [Gossypium arboreum]